jgi:hypothetical protein
MPSWATPWTGASDRSRRAEREGAGRATPAWRWPSQAQTGVGRDYEDPTAALRAETGGLPGTGCAKAGTGLPSHRFVVVRRIEHAKRLLASSSSGAARCVAYHTATPLRGDCARGNRIMCDFVQRGIVARVAEPSPAPSLEIVFDDLAMSA